MRAALFLSVFLLNLPGGWGGEVAGSVHWRGADDYSGAVVYAEKVPREPIVPPKELLVMDQINLTFVPHILPLVVGTTVSFPNSDEVRHNVFSPSPTKRFNLGIYPRGVVRRVTFEKAGEVALLCNVHAEMSAYVLVLETPYFAVTPKEGHYALRNLPPGKYTLTVWHETFKPVTHQVEIKGKETVRMDFRLTVRR